MPLYYEYIIALVVLEKPTMFNPILNELVARERYKDDLRQAEQDRLAEAGIARQPAHRFDLRASLANLSIAVRHLCKALARAG